MSKTKEIIFNPKIKSKGKETSNLGQLKETKGTSIMEQR